MTIALIFDSDCPNVGRAREALRRALLESGSDARWQEVDRGPAGTTSGVGSPTILVNGLDVAGAEADPGGACCRVYPDGAGGFRGAPSVEAIVRAISRAVRAEGGSGRRP